jgi:hypothetical protein
VLTAICWKSASRATPIDLRTSCPSTTHKAAFLTPCRRSAPRRSRSTMLGRVLVGDVAAAGDVPRFRARRWTATPHRRDAAGGRWPSLTRRARERRPLAVARRRRGDPASPPAPPSRRRHRGDPQENVVADGGESIKTAPVVPGRARPRRRRGFARRRSCSPPAPARDRSRSARRRPPASAPWSWRAGRASRCCAPATSCAPRASRWGPARSTTQRAGCSPRWPAGSGRHGARRPPA